MFQMFSVHTTPRNLKTQQALVILDLLLRKTRSGKSYDYGDAIVLEKLRYKMFSNSSGLSSVFEKLRFRDGLVWTEGLTVEIKLRFQISHAVDGASACYNSNVGLCRF